MLSVYSAFFKALRTEEREKKTIEIKSFYL
jgi:hypothetical protein